MARQTFDSKDLRIHNKSDKPDNIVKKENDIYMDCEKIQVELPSFLRPYFAYLKGNVLPMTRLAYLHDIRFFMNYLINETDLTKASETSKITSEEMNNIEAADINLFIDYCRKYMVDNGDTVTVFENSNRSLARKKSDGTRGLPLGSVPGPCASRSHVDWGATPWSTFRELTAEEQPRRTWTRG